MLNFRVYFTIQNGDRCTAQVLATSPAEASAKVQKIYGGSVQKVKQIRTS